MDEMSFFRSAVLLIKSRKEALGLWIWCSTVAALIVGRGFPPLKPSLLSITATLFIAIAVYIYNDIVDVEADRHNEYKSDRPLASGMVKKETAMKLVYISSIVGLGVGLMNGFSSFIFHALFFSLLILYSYPRVHLKKRYLIKESVISIGMIIISLSVSYAILGMFSLRVFAGFFLFAVFAFFTIPTSFDSTDIDADTFQGVKSMASTMPLKQRMQMSLGVMIFIMTVTPLTYSYFGYNILLPASVLLVGVSFLYLMYPLMTKLSQDTDTTEADIIIKARKIIVTFIFIICGCVILGSLSLFY